MQTKQNPLILILAMDDGSQAYFDSLRKQYFPPERNYLQAHLTLFHHLPNEPATFQYFESLQQRPFQFSVDGLRSLGNGVAYNVSSAELLMLHRQISFHYKEILIPQDRQGFRPHITVQNKVLPAVANALLAHLQSTFTPFTGAATGLHLWTYLGGPWHHENYYPFVNI